MAALGLERRDYGRIADAQREWAALNPGAVYRSELFPTSLRGRANGIISGLGRVGSVLGLVTAAMAMRALRNIGLNIRVPARRWCRGGGAGTQTMSRICGSSSVRSA